MKLCQILYDMEEHQLRTLGISFPIISLLISRCEEKEGRVRYTAFLTEVQKYRNDDNNPLY